MNTWYAKELSSGQALIIDETTGENIAVVYDQKYAELLASAPKLLEALDAMLKAYDIGQQAGKGSAIYKARQVYYGYK